MSYKCSRFFPILLSSLNDSFQVKIYFFTKKRGILKNFKTPLLSSKRNLIMYLHCSNHEMLALNAF